MAFPKHLNILLNELYVFNVTKTGVVLRAISSDMDLVQLLSKALRFKFRTYSTEFKDTANGDLVVGSYILPERHYSLAAYPHTISDTTFAVTKPDYTSQTLAFLKPFTLNVWLGIFASIILMAMMHFLMFRRNISFPSALFHVSVGCLGQYRSWRPKFLGQSLLILSWIIGTAFLIMGYLSVLLSSLTVPTRSKGITDFDELHAAMYEGKANATTFPGSGNFYRQSPIEKFKFIGEHIEKDIKVHMNNFHEVIKPNVAVLGSRSLLETYYGRDKYFISQDSSGMNLLTIYGITKNGFCCMDQVNKVIHWIWAAGLNKKIHDTYSYADSREVLREHRRLGLLAGDDAVRPLSLSSLSGVFFILIFGYCLSLISLFCEILIHRYF